MVYRFLNKNHFMKRLFSVSYKSHIWNWTCFLKLEGAQNFTRLACKYANKNSRHSKVHGRATARASWASYKVINLRSLIRKRNIEQNFKYLQRVVVIYFAGCLECKFVILPNCLNTFYRAFRTFRWRGRWTECGLCAAAGPALFAAGLLHAVCSVYLGQLLADKKNASNPLNGKILISKIKWLMIFFSF